MLAAEAALLRDHARDLEPHLPRAVELFYERLFGSHPAVRSLFPREMTSQRGHLHASIALIAKNATRLDALEEPLMQLGAQHASYGALAEHYPIVRDGLLAALRDAAPHAWTPKIEHVWVTALNRVAALMIAGAERAEREGGPIPRRTTA